MRSSITWTTVLTLNALAIATACSSNDQASAVAEASGGAATSTGGNRSTGGSSAKATGGATLVATGGAAPTGGQSSTGGASATPTGGQPSTGGSSAAATGGSSPTAGASATGGTTSNAGATATGGTASIGGASANGGSSSVPTNCQVFTDAPPAIYCSPSGNTIPVNAICTGVLGCSTGGIVIKGGTSGLSISGNVSSAAPIFQSTPFTNGDCASGGISATDATTGTPFTGMSVTLTNAGTSPVVVNILLPDIASAPGSTSLYSATMTASVTVQPGTTPTTVAMHWSDFSPSCTLGNVKFDPTKILALGVSVGGSSTTYPVPVNIAISSLSFTTT